MSDDKKQRSLNGVNYSLSTHVHDHLDNTATPLVLDVYLNNQNDTNGQISVHVQNRTGVNGLLVQQQGTLDVVEYILKSLTQQSNIRLECRPANLINSLNTTGEIQLGPSGSPWLVLGATQSIVQTPLQVNGSVTSSSTVSGSNINTSGFSTNVAPCRVHAATTQSISATTNTKIIFGTIDYDLGSDWSATSNRYVAQTAGIYSIKASARTTGTNRSCKLMVYKNGAFVVSVQDDNTTASAQPSYNGSVDLQLASSDYIEIWFYASASTTLAATDTYFSIYRMA